MAGFLVIWWAFGIGFLTGAGGCFSNTNNGYFATWISFISSLYYLYLTVNEIQNTLEGRDFVNGLVTVAIASVIEFCSAADFARAIDCSSAQYYNVACSAVAWAIACGIISFVIAFVQMGLRANRPELSERTAPVVGMFLVVWWAFGVGFITAARGPFPSSCDVFSSDCQNHNVGRANGYLSSWVAFFASLYFALSTIFNVGASKVDDIVIPQQQQDRRAAAASADNESQSLVGNEMKLEETVTLN